MADGRHFENRYISYIISAANHTNCTKFCMQTQNLPQATETTKKSEIGQFKMADGRRIENHFLAITRLHIVPLQ